MFDIDYNKELQFFIFAMLLSLVIGFFIKEGIGEVLKLTIQVLIAFGSIILLIYSLRVQSLDSNIRTYESEINSFYNSNINFISNNTIIRIQIRFKPLTNSSTC